MTTLSLPSFLEYNILYSLLESRNSYLVVEPAVITHNMKLSLASFSPILTILYLVPGWSSSVHQHRRGLT